MEAYKVLAIDLLEPRVKQFVEMKLKQIQTAHQARSLSTGKTDWSYKVLDQHGNVGVLAFRGVEVALFYKRTATPITMEEMDPIPEGPGIAADKLWIRVELFHTKTSKDRNLVQLKYEKDRDEELATYKGLATQMSTENEQLKNRIQVLEEEKRKRGPVKTETKKPPVWKDVSKKTKTKKLARKKTTKKVKK